MTSAISNQKGVALITTLAVVAILLAAGIQVGRMTGDSALRTRVETSQVQIRELALSGIHLGMFILARDGADNEIDSIQESWADPETIALVQEAAGLPPDQVRIRIEDERGKIQLNSLLTRFPGNEANPSATQLLERFLSLGRDSGQETASARPVEIVNAVKDWLDSSDGEAITGLTGAENRYYQSLEPPVSCANGPFNHLAELFRVKGVAPDLLSSDFTGLAPGNVSGPGRSAPETLRPFFTVYGMDPETTEAGRFVFSGKININTAPLPVLQALMPEGRELEAETVADFRTARSDSDSAYSNDLSGGWLSRAIELSQEEKTTIAGLVTYSSDTFRITCHARKNQAAAALSAVVLREKAKESGKTVCRIIQMEEVI